VPGIVYGIGLPGSLNNGLGATPQGRGGEHQE
jgi:hypothetical protein